MTTCLFRLVVKNGQINPKIRDSNSFGYITSAFVTVDIISGYNF